MKIKFTSLIVACSLFYSGTSKAQIIDKALAQKYSPSVVLQVYNVASKVSLDPKRQNDFGALFQAQDNSLMALIQKGGTAASVDSLKQQTQIKIMRMLSAAEQSEYKAAASQAGMSDNHFLDVDKAIAYRDSIKLSGVQVDSLLRLVQSLKKMSAKKRSPIDTAKPFNKRLYESNSVKAILTKTQTVQLAKLQDKEAAYKKAEAKWKQMDEQKLTNAYDKNATISELSSYYYNKMQDAAAKAVQKPLPSETEKIKEPAALQALTLKQKADTSRSGNNISQLAAAIKFKDKIVLTPAKADTLAARIEDYKKLKKDNRGKVGIKVMSRNAYESMVLNKELSDQQYSMLLSLLSTDKSKAIAQEKWSMLEAKGFATTYDEAKTIAELEGYYFKKLSASNRYAYDKSKLSDMMKNINTEKPAALKALEHVSKNPENDTIGQAYKW